MSAKIRPSKFGKSNFLVYLENLDEDIGTLKIDIEGAEVELLEALFDRPDILERVRHIFAENA